MARYLIIERFDSRNLDAIYRRLNEKGRGLPDGLHFVDSWLTATNDCVYQIMETDDESLFETWFAWWDDLIEFEMSLLREKPEN